MSAWVRVEDQLPEDEEFVLIRSPEIYHANGYNVNVAEYFEGEFRVYVMTNPAFSFCGIEDQVTHWMPLPEPPKEAWL